EPRREADHELLRPVAGDSGLAGLRQRLQDPVGSLHPPRGGKRALQVDAAGRRQGRAAGRGRAAKLEGTPLRRRPAPAVLRTQAMALTLQLPTPAGALENYTLRGTA